MAAKFFLVLCASALFIQNAVGQCGCGGYSSPAIGAIPTGIIGGCGSGLGYNGLNGGIVSSGVATSSGGGFHVATNSPIAPVGITVVSENAIEGPLAVNGQLPLLAAVALEGHLPSSGAAGVTYSCGDSNVGISSQSLSAAGVGAANAAGLGLAGAGYNNIGLVNNGIGFGNIGGVNLGGSPCGCSIY